MNHIAKDASELVFMARGGALPLPMAELASTFNDFLCVLEDHGFTAHTYVHEQRRYKKLPRSSAAQFVAEHLQNDQSTWLTFTPPGTTIRSGTGGGITHWKWDASTAVQTYPRRTGAELTVSIDSHAPAWLVDLFLDNAIRFAQASGLPQAIVSPHNPPALFPGYTAADRARDARQEVFTPELAQMQLREVGWATWLGTRLLERLARKIDINSWPFREPVLTDRGGWFQISERPYELTQTELSRAQSFFSDVCAAE